jgi:hypothetical protein
VILRRLVEQLKAQHWTGVCIELLIVVLGVFIGLRAPEGAKPREDRQAELQIVEDLLADLELDRAAYAGGIAVDERIIGAATLSLTGAGLPPVNFDRNITHSQIASYSLDLSKIPAVPEDRRDVLWTDVVLGYFPRPSTATYDAMVGAGEFKLIRSREIVREIQRYHNLTDTVAEQNAKLLAIREHTLSVGASHGLAPYATMPEGDYFRLVASQPQIAATIRIHATWAIYHRGEIASADARAAILQGQLEAYLEAAK